MYLYTYWLNAFTTMVLEFQIMQHFISKCTDLDLNLWPSDTKLCLSFPVGHQNSYTVQMDRKLIVYFN